MKFIATLLIAATAVLAQQQVSNQGPNVSTGSNAISNPNVNNGFQAQGSFIDGSDSGGNTIDDIMQNFGFGSGAFRRRNAIFNNKGGRLGAPPPSPPPIVPVGVRPLVGSGHSVGHANDNRQDGAINQNQV